jgi:hypothetical protein
MGVARESSLVHSGESIAILKIKISPAIDEKHDHFVRIVLPGSSRERRLCKKTKSLHCFRRNQSFHSYV